VTVNVFCLPCVKLLTARKVLWYTLDLRVEVVFTKMLNST